PMVTLLEGPSISRLVDRALEKMDGTPQPQKAFELHPRSGGELYPLSHGQRALWFLHQLAPESAGYNITGAAAIRADLDIAALRRSFQLLVERHPSLRTTFTARDGEPFQRLHDQMELSFYQEDASAWSDSLLDEHLTARAHDPFDLEKGPLLRVVVFT